VPLEIDEKERGTRQHKDGHQNAEEEIRRYPTRRRETLTSGSKIIYRGPPGRQSEWVKGNMIKALGLQQTQVEWKKRRSGRRLSLSGRSRGSRSSTMGGRSHLRGKTTAFQRKRGGGWAGRSAVRGSSKKVEAVLSANGGTTSTISTWMTGTAKNNGRRDHLRAHQTEDGGLG